MCALESFFREQITSGQAKSTDTQGTGLWADGQTHTPTDAHALEKPIFHVLNQQRTSNKKGEGENTRAFLHVSCGDNFCSVAGPVGVAKRKMR